MVKGYFVVICGHEVVLVKSVKQKISVTLDENIIEKIKEFAEEDDRSVSQYINLFLEEYLNPKQNAEK